jgi:hypothetical protein
VPPMWRPEDFCGREEPRRARLTGRLTRARRSTPESARGAVTAAWLDPLLHAPRAPLPLNTLDNLGAWG